MILCSICQRGQSQRSVAGLRREARDILLRFGIAEEVLNEYLKLLPQPGTASDVPAA